MLCAKGVDALINTTIGLLRRALCGREVIKCIQTVTWPPVVVLAPALIYKIGNAAYSRGFYSNGESIKDGRTAQWKRKLLDVASTVLYMLLPYSKLKIS